MRQPKIACVILNPYSNRWNAKKRWPEVESALHEASVDFVLWETQKPDDGIRLAMEATRQGYSPVISAGGDGSTGEVLNGLYQASIDGVLGPLGLIPLGTANDLAHNLGLPLEINAAARAIAAGKTQRIDLGLANEWAFHNNSAVGLEPVVTLWNERMVHFKGVLRYLVAALRAIASGTRWSAHLEWDDGSYEGPLSLVSVGNCAVTGGLFRMTPAASPHDGKLTFVYGFVASRLKMLSLFPNLINGSYINDPAIHQHHTTHLAIELSPGSPFQVDGVVRATDLTHVDYRVLPDRLDILGAW